MFMRTFSVAALTLVLSACGSPGEQEEMADIDGKLYCAVDGANELTQSCTLERIDGPEGHVLVLHHPGGGFRRFRIVSDGRGVIPADGAEQEQLALAGDQKIDVPVANVRYCSPTTLGPKAAKTQFTH